MFGAKAATEKFTGAVEQRTGPTAQNDRFAGTFQGMRASSQTQMVASVGAAVMGRGGLPAGLGAAIGGSTGGMMQAMTDGDYTCGSAELQEQLERWPYLNLSWDGTQVWVELLDSTTRTHGKFGTTAMQDGGMVLQGLSLAAAAARATMPR